jgi:DNA primase
MEKRLKTIQQQLHLLGSNMEQTKKLLQEYMDTKEIRDALARRLGSDLIV